MSAEPREFNRKSIHFGEAPMWIANAVLVYAFNWTISRVNFDRRRTYWLVTTTWRKGSPYTVVNFSGEDMNIKTHQTAGLLLRLRMLWLYTRSWRTRDGEIERARSQIR